MSKSDTLKQKPGSFRDTKRDTHSFYLGSYSQGPSVWPWWAHSAGSRTLTGTLDHRTASPLTSTSQTLSGYPAPYNSHTSPPSGHDDIALVNVLALFFHIEKHVFHGVRVSRPYSTSRWTSEHTPRCRSPGSYLRAVGLHLSYRVGCSGYSSHISDPNA